MKTADFDYELPPELVAAYPAAARDASRLLVVDPAREGFAHRTFADLPEYLRAGDCLVLNESRVIPARLRGRRASGGVAEALLLEPAGGGRWRAMVKPGKKLPPGSRFLVGDEDDPEAGEVAIEEALSEGERVVRIETGYALDRFLERFGRVPLPPYIVAARKKSEDADEEFDDRGRYQTVYARLDGSVAAPTAGLHFTEGMLGSLAASGIEIRRVALHVGPGTFQPVKEDDPRAHPMHSERFEVGEEEAKAIEAARRDAGRRIVAVGTTVVRVLESLMAEEGEIKAGEFSTELLILPGFRFRAVDAMITNFHLPKSTLLMLVSALAGRERIMAAYREAVEKRYRFYSYGDAMFIAGRAGEEREA